MRWTNNIFWILLFPSRTVVGTKEKNWKRKRNVACDLKSSSSSSVCSMAGSCLPKSFLKCLSNLFLKMFKERSGTSFHGNLFHTFYKVLWIYNLVQSCFCRDQLLGPHKCWAEERGSFVCPADNIPVYKALGDTCKITLNSNPLLLVVCSRVISSADVIRYFSIQASRSWIKSLGRTRSWIDTYKTLLSFSFHSNHEPEYVVAECSSLQVCTQPALVSSAL